MRGPRFGRALLVVSLWCLASGGAGDARAQDFASAEGAADRKLEQSLGELARVREKVAKEKVPLSRRVSELENEVIALRRERDQLLKVRDSRTIDLSSLRAQVESLGEQEDFVNSRLNEFVRDFEARLDVSELPRYEAKTGAAKLAGKNTNLDAAGKRQAQIDVVDSALERLRVQLGGEVYEGAALSDGVLVEGAFAKLGPTVFFSARDGSVAGLVENQLNAADPVVVPLPGGFDAGIEGVARGEKGALPFDATLGKAFKLEKARKGLLAYINDGGAVGYVILGLGLAALVLTAFKAREILGFPVAAHAEVDRILDDLSSGDAAGAAGRASALGGVSGEMLSTGVEHVEESRGTLEELLFEKILKARPGLERFLPFLAITAAAAPLLGLLGTVIGMIKTFQLITIFGTGDAKSLSSGISEALVTTALGLIVAIPTLILHGALSRMAKHKLGMLEQLSVAFVNGVSSLRTRAGR